MRIVSEFTSRVRCLAIPPPPERLFDNRHQPAVFCCALFQPIEPSPAFRRIMMRLDRLGRSNLRLKSIPDIRQVSKSIKNTLKVPGPMADESTSGIDTVRIISTAINCRTEWIKERTRPPENDKLNHRETGVGDDGPGIDKQFNAERSAPIATSKQVMGGRGHPSSRGRWCAFLESSKERLFRG